MSRRSLCAGPPLVLSGIVFGFGAILPALIYYPSSPEPSTPPKKVINSIGMEFSHISAGRFKMGSPEKEAQRSHDETQHEVIITQEFWLGVHEVTQRQFKKVMGYNPSYFSADGKGKPGATYCERSKPAGGKGKIHGETGDYPVENVSWTEAIEFCTKLNDLAKEHGRTYRLPTEAEWEYACRAGTACYQVFCFGNSLSSEQANFDGRYPYGNAEKGRFFDHTCTVGSYQPNGFGLYDMHGNVWEWCLDRYDKDYYSRSPRKDPQGPASSRDEVRVMRGGCFYDSGEAPRSANRNRATPDSRTSIIGFRVVHTLARGQKP